MVTAENLERSQSGVEKTLPIQEQNKNYSRLLISMQRREERKYLKVERKKPTDL